ncbi:MAG: hypothetical protein A2X37_07265 [Elusimicrobia bacterium GWA2_66_18]|nr:MAG: hypothetical protein A2X37_07265 [Elusimicrobia bacterium GWA2_66_18]
MNDDLREKLSAYLDGALPEAERLGLEARLTASADLRLELEGLRAVSKAVKDLTKSPLPPGFLARLAARRARVAAPRRDWVLLPPSYRPVAFALSSAIVAIAVWDQFNRTEAPPARTYEAVKVVPSSQAPTSQLDLSAKVTGTPEGGSSLETLKKISRANVALEGMGLAERKEQDTRADLPAAPGEPLGFKEDALSPGKAAKGMTMTEERRSSRNEELIGALEKEKRSLSIARVPPRGAGVSAVRGGSAGLDAAPLSTPAPADYASGALSPDAGLVVVDDAGLAFSWTLLGLPGRAPSVDYAGRRAVLLKRSRTKLLETRSDPDRVSVYFRLLAPGEAADPAKDRFTTIPIEPKPVSLILLPR